MANTGIITAGFKELERALKLLPDRIQRRVMRTASTKAARPIVKAAKANARRTKTGRKLLAKSIGQRSKSYTATQTIVTVIGPRWGFKQEVGRTGAGKAIYEDPAKIAHLVEHGHVLAIGGNVVGHVPAHPFLRPAFESQKGPALAIYKRELAAGIEREARKLAGKR